MQSNVDELRAQIRKLTFKFAFVGWVASAATVGLLGGLQVSPSLLQSLKTAGGAAGAMAAVSLIPLFISTYLASRWMNWILFSNEKVFSSSGKLYYGALLTLLISVGGAGLIVVTVFNIADGFASSSEAFTLLLLGAGYPLVWGIWFEIPAYFFYVKCLKKKVKAFSNG